MTASAPERAERETLEHEVSHVLEEARMIVPGIQALFGFQLVAVFNQTFFGRLDVFHQRVHLVAIAWIVLAMGFVMTPAAYHRQAERGWVTGRLVGLGSRLLQLSLVALACGVGLDVYVIAYMVLGLRWMALVVSATLLAALSMLWFLLPAILGSGAATRRSSS
ncbi:MAG TPA: DUF6328 family protein [Polyangiaceae bacterium]|nr:DUF6328 family protein [Polyangiaceae bacterium]